MDTVRRWLDTGDNHTKIDRIIFCVFLDTEKECYELLMKKFFPKSGDSVVALSNEEEKEMYAKEELFEEGTDPEEDEPIKPESRSKSEMPAFLFVVGAVLCIVVGVYVVFTRKHLA